MIYSRYSRIVSKILSVVLLLGFSSCIGYNITMSGLNISPEIKTISIELFQNQATLGPANMHIQFTEDLRDFFQSNTPLRLVNQGGDLSISGYIKSFQTRPVAPTISNTDNGLQQVAQQQQLTITISINYFNKLNEEASFENKSLNGLADYDANQNLTDVQDELMDEIFEQIRVQVFNITVASW